MKKMTKSVTELQERMRVVEEELAYTQQALTEALQDKEALEQQVAKLEADMEEERSRHRIEVAELEGIQAQMMKEIEEKDVRIGGLEAEVAGVREALAAEQEAHVATRAEL